MLEQPGEIKKLERDGFNREAVVQAMYKATDGMSTQQRTDMMNRLYDRRK